MLYGGMGFSEWWITKVTFRQSEVLNSHMMNSGHKRCRILTFQPFLRNCLGKKKKKTWHLWLHWTMRPSGRKKAICEQRREPFMSLIQVVQGHRAQCTLVDCSPRIHRSFLFPDIVHAALPWGAWQRVTSPLCVRDYVCVAKGPEHQPISTSCRLQTLRAPCLSC